MILAYILTFGSLYSGITVSGEGGATLQSLVGRDLLYQAATALTMPPAFCSVPPRLQQHHRLGPEAGADRLPDDAERTGYAPGAAAAEDALQLQPLLLHPHRLGGCCEGRSDVGEACWGASLLTPVRIPEWRDREVPGML